LEETLPRPGVYSITDGVSRAAIDTHAQHLRELYHAQFGRRLHHLRSELLKLQVPLITIRTDQIVLDQLETWKHKIP
ncbi:MAG: hypothetical protein LBF16_00790, partial [Pseudomonadales bacterium]|nr:hypothetical protein [Pseudomonadales bacterium]